MSHDKEIDPSPLSPLTDNSSPMQIPTPSSPIPIPDDTLVIMYGYTSPSSPFTPSLLASTIPPLVSSTPPSVSTITDTSGSECSCELGEEHFQYPPGTIMDDVFETDPLESPELTH